MQDSSLRQSINLSHAFASRLDQTFSMSVEVPSPAACIYAQPDRDIRSLGRVAQSVGHLNHKSGVLDSIPGLATYFRFSFCFFQEGQLLVTGESMCTKYWLTA